MMIQKIFSFDEYEGFVNELSKHPQYSDPHFTYDKNNLYCSLKSKDKHAYVVLENFHFFHWKSTGNFQEIKIKN